MLQNICIAFRMSDYVTKLLRALVEDPDLFWFNFLIYKKRRLDLIFPKSPIRFVLYTIYIS